MGNDANSTTGAKSGPAASAVKDWISIVRDGLLLLLFILLVAAPESFNGLLVRAGFEEGSLVGFKWKRQLQASDQALKDLEAVNADLTKQNTALSAALSEATTATSDPAAIDRVEKLEADNTRLTEAARAATDSARATIVAQAELVRAAQISTGADVGWGVVFGADTSFAGARDEVARRGPANELRGGRIYLRKGYYRSVVVTNTRAEADALLVHAKKLRSDAYVVPLSSWCSNPVEETGFTRCAP